MVGPLDIGGSSHIIPPHDSGREGADGGGVGGAGVDRDRLRQQRIVAAGQRHGRQRRRRGQGRQQWRLGRQQRWRFGRRGQRRQQRLGRRRRDDRRGG